MPPINDREGMEGGCGGISANEANRGREWLFPEAMKIDGGMLVGLRLCVMACSVKK